jgi:DNA-binding transcriptional LysR family regulator
VRFTLRQLEYFGAACEAGSLTVAARRTGVSQSTISAAVAQLERLLGVELLVRHHARGVSPTPAGRQLLAEAKSLLRDAAELERLAFELTEEVRGRLDLGCLVTLAPIVAPRLCAEFRDRHAAVEIDLVESGQEELLRLLHNGELSLVLTYDLELGQDIAFEGLAELPPYALLPAGHPHARRDGVGLEELAQEPFILLDLPLSREYFRSLFLAAGLEPNVKLRSPHLDVIRGLVANGFGYSLVNARPQLDRALDGRRLATVRLEGEHRALRLGIASLAAVRDTRAAAAFKEHCRRRVETSGLPGVLGSEPLASAR